MLIIITIIINKRRRPWWLYCRPAAVAWWWCGGFSRSYLMLDMNPSSLKISFSFRFVTHDRGLCCTPSGRRKQKTDYKPQSRPPFYASLVSAYILYFSKHISFRIKIYIRSSYIYYLLMKICGADYARSVGRCNSIIKHFIALATI